MTGVAIPRSQIRAYLSRTTPLALALLRQRLLKSIMITYYRHSPGLGSARIGLWTASAAFPPPRGRGAFFDRRWCNARCFLPWVD